MEDLVEEFLEQGVYAVVGATPNPEKYGFKVMVDLERGGYTVYPVNPKYSEIEGRKCYPDLDSLPEKPDVVEFVSPPKATEKILEDVERLGISRVWMQPGAESPEAISFCEEQGITAMHDICVMVERKKRNA